MRRYLLDTNILFDLIKNPQSKAAKRAAAKPIAALCTSVIVAAELRYGCEKKGVATLTARVDELLNHIEVVALLPEVDREYGRIRVALERIGKPIGGNDLFIAAHAIALDAVLVTANVDEFKRVKGLKVENWLD